MKKTKAAFRAIREECGFSQQDIADEADVSIRSVKFWEDTREDRQPPDNVWQFLLAARGALYQDAREIAEQITKSLKQTGATDLQLRYYRTQEQLDAYQLGTGVDEPYGYANARMREVARLLDKAEIPYTFSYDA